MATLTRTAWPAPSAVAELLKPITWFPPMWAFVCGAVSTGVPLGADLGTLLLGITLAGPMVCATSQAVNDWFDREVDAINEPQRPIPSGRMPGQWGLAIAVLWTLLSLAVAAVLGPQVLAAATLGLVLAWAYSAPPVRLKRNGWWGNAACAACYEGLAWVTGAAILSQGALDPCTLTLAALYSLGAHGIMTLNDFKSIEGDRQMGIGSLPVRLGVRGAAFAACGFMVAAQLAVAACLYVWGAPLHTAAVLGLLAPQVWLMRRFVQNPVAKALELSGFGVTLFVAGMMVSAFALRTLMEATR
jgi:chlorophyll synthase